MIAREIDDPFFAQPIEVISIEAKACGIDLVLGYAKGDPEEALASGKVLDLRQSDGLLLLGDLAESPGDLELLAQMGKDRRTVSVFRRAQLACWYPAMEGAWHQVPELGGGAHGVVDVNLNVPGEAAQSVLEIQGTGGLVLADRTIGQEPGCLMSAYAPGSVGGYDAAQARAETGIARPIDYAPINTYRGEVEHFADFMEQDLQPITGGAERLRFVRLTQLVDESAAAGKVITL